MGLRLPLRKTFVRLCCAAAGAVAARIGTWASMIWQIGDWTVDSTTDTIADGSQTRKLEHRATEVLLHLAERQGVVVTKDDLIVNVWGRFAVSDHAVAMVISQLRQALGDDARTPRY